MNERARFEAAWSNEGGWAQVQPAAGIDKAAAWWGWQAALADRPEPAQPVARRRYTPVYVDGIPTMRLAADGDWVPFDAALDAAPPSHPAPSEAGAERQERDRE